MADTDKQAVVTTVAKTLGADKLLPCILVGMVLYFLYLAMTPMFTSTNESFKDYIRLTEKRLVVEERIANALEQRIRDGH